MGHEVRLNFRIKPAGSAYYRGSVFYSLALEFTQSLYPRATLLTRSRGVWAHLLWSLPPGTSHLVYSRGPGAGDQRTNAMRRLTTHKHREFSYLRAYMAPPPSTSVENLLQINLFLQNKANVKIGKINLSIAIIKDYKNLWLYKGLKNKPNSNPIKPNQTQFWAKNKANSKPIQSQTKPITERPKMNANLFTTKDYG